MDINIASSARRGIQAGRECISTYDFAALAKWQTSPTGSAEAAKRIRTWAANGDWSATLDLAQLDLHSCPPLPPEVQHLILAFNPELDTLPQPLPPALTNLNINFCNFTRLPHEWPVGLIELMAVTSKVAEFPATLPAGLQCLYLTNNALTGVPARLPAGLQALYLGTNSIGDLDPALLSLPNCRKLNLCNNPLSDASLTMLRECTAGPAYAGPAVKIGIVSEWLDTSEWLPAERTAEMQRGEGPPVIRRPAGSLTTTVNAMLRANPNSLVASYSDQHNTIVQVLGLRSDAYRES
jgi:hypothetical protein